MRSPRRRPRTTVDVPLTRKRRTDGDATRARVYAVALDLFRRKGFAETTMRDVAKAAGLSLGAAYHHFATKDAILRTYFDEKVGEHERSFATKSAGITDLRERLAIAFDTALEPRRKDRVLLGALAKVVLDRESTASVFGEPSGEFRRRSIAIFARAADVPIVPDDVRPLLASALWALQLGLLLYFVDDTSPGARRTKKLTSEVLDLVPPLVLLLAMPALEGTREKLLRALAEARIPLAG
jgi:AcrR family transcriptional regulator